MPRAAVRPGTGTIAVPMDRRVDRCLAHPDRTSHSGAIRESA